MKKFDILKMFLVLCVALILTIEFAEGPQAKHHYVAGDDLPIYIGKSAPRC